MDRSVPAAAESDPSQLRPILEQYFGPNGADADALHSMVCGVFCASADAGIPVERALAAVNAEIDAAAAGAKSAVEGMRALRRVVMVCCLDCYYPDNPRGDGQRASA